MAVRAPSIENKLAPVNEGMPIQAKSLSVNLLPQGARLSGVSMPIQPGEFLVLLGPHPANQTALLEAMMGTVQPAEGEILINGVNLTANRKVLQGYIGYVPAEMPLHEQLTPREILLYEANLRLGRGTSHQFVQERALEVLDTVGLQAVADHKLANLRNYEKRLVNLAIELLTRPPLLLIDAPQNSLTAGQEVKLSQLLQELANQGYTIIQAVNNPRCATLADKLVILGGDGSLVWFGPPLESLEYLRGLHPRGEELNSSFNLDHALEVLETAPPNAKNWGEVFKGQAAYQRYVDDPLSGKHADLLLEDRPVTRFRGVAGDHQPPPKLPQAPGLRKMFTLISRNLTLLFRERTFQLLLLVPLLLGLMDFILSSPQMLDPLVGDANRLPVVLGLLVFFNVLAAALLFQRGMMKEKSVYRWESRTVSMAVPYVFSKLWFIGFFAVYQGIVWALIHFLATGMTGGVLELVGSGVTFVLLAWIGGIIGLMAAALAGSALGAAALALLFVLPQLLLSGSLVPTSHLAAPARPLAVVNPAMYAFGTLMTVSGYGRDVVSDVCWQLPEDQRLSLTENQKQGCICMGDNIFSGCHFPGIHKSFSAVIEQSRPIAPTPDPILNSPPIQPLLKPGDTLEKYADAVNQYTLEMESYLATEDSYTTSLRRFSNELADWQRQRSQVVASAEQTIEDAVEHYGTTFQVALVPYWIAIAAISLVLILLLTVIVMAKGI